MSSSNFVCGDGIDFVDAQELDIKIRANIADIDLAGFYTASRQTEAGALHDQSPSNGNMHDCHQSYG